MKKINTSFKTDKAAGSDGILAKFVKLSANVTDSHLTDIINRDIPQNNYSTKLQTLNQFSKKIIEQRQKIIDLLFF